MRRGLAGLLVFGCAAAVWAVGPAATADPPKDAPAADAEYTKKIRPFLDTYCNKCHNSDKNAGGVPLDVYTSTDHAKKDRKTWETVLRVIADGEMPPKSKPQPPKAEKDAVATWIQNSVTKVDCTAEKNPGRVTIRRLNRAEYNNTVRDLCGIDFTPADDFPSDDVGYGFDNIGDVLSVQPILVEKYMAAADKILNAAIPSLAPVKAEKQKFQPQTLQTIPRSARMKEKNEKGREIVSILLTTEGAAFIEKHNFPADGEYALRVKAWGRKEGTDGPKASLRIDGKEQAALPVTAEKGKSDVYEVKVKVTTGDHRVAVALANPTADAKVKEPRGLGVEYIEIEGPLGTAARPLSDAAKKILIEVPKTVADNRSVAEQVLTTFTRKAFRRPVKADEVTRLMKLYDIAAKQGESFEDAIKLPIKAVLVSPHFLFRVEDDPTKPDLVRPLTEHELASRLSYFLWSTMPDDELFRLADAGQLRQNLPAQVKRMLKDRKARALTENFAGQWLMLRSVKTFTPDTARFKGWDEKLRDSIIRETELTFEHVVKEDRSVLEFLDADYTFLNERLAKHYGITGVKGDDFRKVVLKDANRGGLLTQASVLAVTSNPTRTSPVKRGKWVLENILGTPPPPPAPDVPELPPVGQIKGTLRQQMEQHRANPSCANCHAKLDPLGFGLENFDAVGKWRDEDNGQKIDPSGVLPGGKAFAGPAELKKVLLGKSDQFRRCLAEKLLTFALGRGMEYPDRCVLDDVTKKLAAGGDKFSALVLVVVESDPFQKRSGKRSE